jgi:pimeloyl-ACP methyl ester carboxylesterase
VQTATKVEESVQTFRSFDGVTIAYHDEGRGPAVVLLHGYGLDGLSTFGDFGRSARLLRATGELCRAELGFAPPVPDPPPEGRAGLIPALAAAGARVLVPDLRGFGASGKPREQAAYAGAAMARDVVALIAHLGLEAVDVLGHSMGSVVAAKLLALGVPALRSAVLAGVGDYLLEGVELDLPRSWPVPASLPRPFTLEASAEQRASVLEAGTVDPADLASLSVLAARAAGDDPAVLAAVLRGALQSVAASELAGVSVPVLVLNAGGDLANRKAGRLVEAIPGAVAAACEGDHLSMLWNPTFHQAAAAFFRRARAARP